MTYKHDLLQVNVIGLSVCAREAYQSMKERNVDDGHIININRYGMVLCDVFITSCTKESQSVLKCVSACVDTES